MERNLELEAAARAKSKEVAINVGVPESDMDAVEVKFAYMGNIVAGGLDEEGSFKPEIAIIVSVETPQGRQHIFNTVIVNDENVMTSVENAFPTKEDIENEKAALSSRQAQMMHNPEGMSTQEMIDAAMENIENSQQGIIVDDVIKETTH